MKTKLNWLFDSGVIVFLLGDMLFIYAPIKAGGGFPFWGILTGIILPVVIYYMSGSIKIDFQKKSLTPKFRIPLSLTVTAVAMFTWHGQTIPDFPSETFFNSWHSASTALIVLGIVLQLIYFFINKDLIPRLKK